MAAYFRVGHTQYHVWAADATRGWSRLHLLLNQLVKLSWLVKLNKFGQNTVLLSLREGFIALLPYYVMMAMSTLLNQALPAVFSSQFLNSFSQLVSQTNQVLMSLFPILVVVSVSYQLSRHLQIHSIFSCLFATICFICFSDYGGFLSGVHQLGAGSFDSLYAVLLAVLCPYLLQRFSRISYLKINTDNLLSPFLQQHMNFIAPAVMVFFLLLIVVAALSLLLPVDMRIELDFSDQTLIVLRTVGSTILWAIGVHGINVYDSIFGNDYLANVLPNGLSVNSFFSLFVYIGGNIMGVIIACLWIGKRHKSQAIAKLSLPFSLFNLSEIIIYGLPLVCNPIMLIPMVATILAHCLLGLWLVQLNIWQFTGTEISWLTPIFIDAWWATGDWTLLLYQALMVGLDTLIYAPFIFVHDRLNNPELQAVEVHNKLLFHQQVRTSTESRYSFAQADHMVKDLELSHALQAINDNELILHYQPKISLSGKRVDGFEALLRIQNNQGKIDSPWFIDVLGQNQLSHLIDSWVIEQVRRDLESAQQQGLCPKVSLNIHPQSLSHEDVVTSLLALAEGFPEQLEVEILETSIDMPLPTVHQQLTRIRQAGLPIAIDDFGSGYSNLSRLFGFAPEVIKLDRSLLVAPSDQKGVNNYLKLTAMCKGLGYKIVAEGVETDEQQDLVTRADVDLIQGWIFSPAMPWSQALRYQPL